MGSRAHLEDAGRSQGPVMLEKVWAAWGISGASLLASLAVATTVLQFLTAAMAFVSAVIGFYLLVRKWRSEKP